ncbi:MAG: FtsX-like permease family protein [Bacteroidetes bacterium]|nr:MAG: FtsX-like permease family protein [Bacteroidota bacterium]
MAWRDSRRNRGRLILFISSIILGIGALVAINSFSENLQHDINKEAKSLLGCDLLVQGNQAAPDSILMLFDSLAAEARAESVNLLSMALFPKNGGTRLVMVKALEGGYPFYGKLATEPPTAAETFQNGQKALVEKTIMYQFGLEPGDSVQVGNVVFEIEGYISSAPGRAGFAGSIVPLIYIPMKYLPATNLVQNGSRIFYQYYFKFADDVDVPALAKERLRPRLRKGSSLGYDTVEERKEELGRAFNDLTAFLNLVGFIALLLGCIGVASSVHIYIKDKLPTIAVLRCLGARGQQAFWIYLIQVMVLGMAGGILGALLGSIIQVFLPLVVADFLPVQNVSNDISWSAIGMGMVTGLVITILFALLPLLAIRHISPLRTLRASFEEDTQTRDPLRWVVYGLIGLFIFGFTWFQTGDWRAFVFPVGVGVAFLILTGIAKLLTFLVKKYFPRQWSFIWRQSIANLYRPNNQTLLLIVTVGLGTALISTLFFTQDLLLKQVEMTGAGNQPNMIVFDIQTSQKEAVAELTRQHGLPLIQQVPIVTMRIDAVDGMTKADRLRDSTSKVSRWVFNREFRCTYRDTLIDTETLIEGEWHGEAVPGEPVYVSIAENIADNLNAKIGTPITFNVQGALIETIVGSIRKVNFSRLQTNFFVVFPKGVLEAAPQFHVIVSRVNDERQSAAYQQELVQKFPNISVIDLTQILRAVEDVLGKVSFVIRFMALFSILTGLLVLISSVVLSKYQRIRESVLLRTLGAGKRHIILINALEYFFLGSLATLTGIGISLIGSFLLAKFQFHIPFEVRWAPIAATFASITGLTILIGMLNTREVIRKPPLEILRKEV